MSWKERDTIKCDCCGKAVKRGKTVKEKRNFPPQDWFYVEVGNLGVEDNERYAHYCSLECLHKFSFEHLAE